MVDTEDAEFEKWMEEDKEEKNEELTLNNGNYFSYGVIDFYEEINDLID